MSKLLIFEGTTVEHEKNIEEYETYPKQLNRTKVFFQLLLSHHRFLNVPSLYDCLQTSFSTIGETRGKRVGLQKLGFYCLLPFVC